jgi:hypothetical protein
MLGSVFGFFMVFYEVKFLFFWEKNLYFTNVVYGCFGLLGAMALTIIPLAIYLNIT